MTHTSRAARPSRVARLATLVPTALLGAVAMAGCGAESTAIEASSAEKVRTAAQVAGESPRTCPVTLNVAKALRAGGQAGDATFTEATASVSTSEKPAEDPTQAQVDGTSLIDAFAATFIECHYAVGEKNLKVSIVATPTSEVNALFLVLPTVQKDAQLASAQVQGFVETAPAKGEVVLAGDRVATSRLDGRGPGDVALTLTGGGLSGEALTQTAQALLQQLRG
ncbi:hypothetical protein BJ980_003684 [Nocardioides daedukensis]|uniref:DUF3558 domain-containing protein n=1 Tax=Nocardioides daedukensis TaxID=634462 RepID=A0A7Y9USB2_9ACTN|nr:hypothetical protein [Nocardioides daedukensis]NYG60761.1 hypothetical protein [Nocardioides daedukensis]